MDSIYHSGELTLQREAGTEDAAAGLGRSVLPVISHLYVDFIQSRPFLIVGTADTRGMAWAAILSGSPGFMKVIDEQTLGIAALPDDRDPPSGLVRDGCDIGLLLIDPSTRRRLRLNGRVAKGEGGFTVRTTQVYANCPRYIQSRTLEPGDRAAASPRSVLRSTSLNGKQHGMIGRADTFFVASYHPAAGADVSHRGGYPGFVQVLDEGTVVWPDYNGNGMFNTLGNIRENHRCGLLFLDFETGTTLQLSGTGQVITDRERAAELPGAERIIEFKVNEVIEIGNGTGLRSRFNDYSPDNPWFC